MSNSNYRPGSFLQIAGDPTVWGLRDADSWLRSPKENPDPPWDAPLLFDDDGRAKPLLGAVAKGLAS